jgi:hypothetical protein
MVGVALVVLAIAAWYFGGEVPGTAEVELPVGVTAPGQDSTDDVAGTSSEPVERSSSLPDSAPPSIDLTRVMRAADVPDTAVNVDIARSTLDSNEHRLIPVELDCSPKDYGEVYCVPTPDSLIANHPYFTYPIESLFLIQGDPIAHQVISLRITRSDPAAGLQHAIRATGLSGGRAEPLVEFVTTSGWGAWTEGEPLSDSFASGYVVWRAAESLGYPANVSRELRDALLEQMSEAEVDALDTRVTELLDAIAAVPVAREWETRS